jgi:hypothetical protein
MGAGTFLAAVVDVAIAIAGFAGIVAAIRQRRLSSWPPDQLILLQILFFASAASIVAGILPAFLTETGMKPNHVWKVCSAVLICWLIGAPLFRARQCKALGVKQQIPMHVLVWAVVSIVLQCYNIAATGTAWPYLFGVTTMLINGFSVFLLLVLKPTESTEESR